MVRARPLTEGLLCELLAEPVRRRHRAADALLPFHGLQGGQTVALRTWLHPRGDRRLRHPGGEGPSHLGPRTSALQATSKGHTVPPVAQRDVCKYHNTRQLGGPHGPCVTDQAGLHSELKVSLHFTTKKKKDSNELTTVYF